MFTSVIYTTFDYNLLRLEIFIRQTYLSSVIFVLLVNFWIQHETLAQLSQSARSEFVHIHAPPN